MSRILLLLRFCLVFFLSLSSALLFLTIFSDYWVIRESPIGTIHEGLLRSCSPFECTSVARGSDLYDSVVILLTLSASFECGIVVVFLLIFFFKVSVKNIDGSCIIEAIAVMVAMSIYTGYFTSDVPAESRGWCFKVAWFTFPSSLIAGLLAVIHQRLFNEEDELVTVIPRN
ncbi:epithelial membrane protein 2-like [Anolis sagrei]|uniref:epithelial membrane protein 2-like n=1 Tax=Anolis sagrei TaxID=38937 RepID=UPI00351FEFAB